MIEKIRKAIRAKDDKLRGNKGPLSGQKLTLMVSDVYDKWCKKRKDKSDLRTLDKIICEVVDEEHKR